MTPPTRRQVVGALPVGVMLASSPPAHAALNKDIPVTSSSSAEIGSRDSNKALLKAAFEAVEKGDASLYWGLLAENIRFTIIGSTAWSRTFTGKAEVADKLFGPLRGQLEGYNKSSAQWLIGDGDVVVVQGRGHNRTRAGQAYENRYAWVFHMRGGKVHAIKEYSDTELVARVLSAPPV